jgi:uncharacterized membrane protein
MSIIHSPVGWLHFLAALVALLSGSVILLRPKGGLFHRRCGYVYAASMLLVNATAFLIYRLFGGFGPFHFAALVSLFSLVQGLLPAWRRPSGWLLRHYYHMSWSVLGLYAAFIAETGVRLVPRGGFWFVVFGSLGLVMFLGSRLIRQNARHWSAEA